MGLPRWLCGKESTRQCRRYKRCRFNPQGRKIPQRRKWQPTPVFQSGKSCGQRSLVGYSPWSCKRVRHDLLQKTLKTLGTCRLKKDFFKNHNNPCSHGVYSFKSQSDVQKEKLQPSLLERLDRDKEVVFWDPIWRQEIFI